MKTSTLIRGATIVDGTGADRYVGDLLVVGDRIGAIGNLGNTQADRVIEARGTVAAPGFIDTHVHTDMTLLNDPVHECFLFQGVTTAIMGQDGLSYAPLSPNNLSMFRRYLKGLNGDTSKKVEWESVAEYRALFDGTVSMNTAYPIPHAALRLETVGFADVPLEGDHLKRARQLMERGFEEGAAGFSTGLSYFPNTYADTAELVALSEVAAAADRPYITHLRSVFQEPQTDWILAGLEEGMEIGRRSGVAVHVSHFGPKPARYSSPEQMLAPVDRARSAGVEVTLEVYPYPAGNSYLLIHLPPWAHEGGPDAILDLIRSGRERQRLVREIEGNTIPPYGSQVAYIQGEGNQYLVGRRLDDIAQDRGVSIGEVVLQLLDESDLAVGGREAVPNFDGIWEKYRSQLMQILARGDYMIGSDGIPSATYPHPRTFGSFPRVLRMARETGALSLEQVVHLMTQLPAETFRLTDRGVIRKGAFADLVLFEPDSITDHATYEDPTRPSTGVTHLFVNGEPVISDGAVTGRLPGRAV